MLDDTPRKLLRIMFQFRYHFKRMPTLPELRRLSGRRPAEIKKGLKVLVDEHYIKWEPSDTVDNAVIIEGWERNVPFDTGPQQAVPREKEVRNIDYWLYH
ncbi:hypothetical protein [Paenibacillus sp. DMB5]|uniref:hypothetical protein n=1 Tax=Paenibacillus sp. DMB5 TaxID=1780103 RepID=UPI00076CA8B6|nr:hypothetical protein [Paenibacillus sp. DMB5]KUP22435.1 hypothetical protein AWJ19_27865 [Paenibacillus sp. DMB5]